MAELRVRPLVTRTAVTAGHEGDHLPRVDPILRRLYAARGVTGSEQLDYALRHLLPVGSLGGIDAAVDLILRHRENRIIVIGDFDADGATSTALKVTEISTRRVSSSLISFSDECRMSSVRKGTVS